ncbi:hypothetical protein F0562_021027 [Nyssa sinensis]|uniref:BSD domain-containing protein n=1 Tax=Nyssa sinensis TaxID=561372 RepID=A0A5J5BLD3_9ASTE|nr:hypothetical protein F0562_021027 [Nyssa sinensis]
MDAYSWLRRSLSRPKKTSMPSSATPLEKPNEAQEDEEELFGITDQLIEFVKSFTLDTFKNFSLPDEQEANSGDDTPTTSGNIRKDLSDWQERHAMLVLSKVKEMSQLRFRLCPRYLKEQQFWRIYFMLVKSYVTEYELHAIQLAKLKQMTIDNEKLSDTTAYEVEMSEVINVEPPTSLEHKLDSVLSDSESRDE